MTHRSPRSILAVSAAGLLCAAAYAATAIVVDPPDLKINAVSGLIETVDATWSGSNYNVRYTVVSTSGQQSSTLFLTSVPANDLDPRIAISSGGDASVVWWRDTSPNALILRKHVYATGAWSSERTLGTSTESNSRPRLVYFGDKLFAGYQIQSGKTRCVAAVQIIDDDPEPIRSIIASTTYYGDPDIRPCSESGHLWVTWVDTSLRVGYSEYITDKNQWTVPLYDSYANDSIAASRSRIRSAVLGL